MGCTSSKLTLNQTSVPFNIVEDTKKRRSLQMFTENLVKEEFERGIKSIYWIVLSINLFIYSLIL